MKFDVAKNEDGPLRKTVNARGRTAEESPPRPERQKDAFGTSVHLDGTLADAGRYPGLDERLNSLEDHLAVRYGEDKNRYTRVLCSSAGRFSSIATTLAVRSPKIP